MEPVLDDKEIRVIGCLIEKQLATPEYYPLSLNARSASWRPSVPGYSLDSAPKSRPDAEKQSMDP